MTLGLPEGRGIEAREELEEVDLRALGEEMSRFERRLSFWSAWQLELLEAGVEPDR
jgi:hypothetical protein